MKAATVAAAMLMAVSTDAFVMSAGNGLTRADFAKVAGAAVAGVALPAFAAGGGPKQNIFGVVGEGNELGGGFSSPYAEVETYSPYSPYSNTATGKAVFKGTTDEMTKNYIANIKDCKSRFEKIPGWSSKGQWMEIRAELTRKAYELRSSMNALAKTPAAQAAAKDYYADLEVMMTEARLKNGAKVSAAYDKSTKDLAAFLAAL